MSDERPFGPPCSHPEPTAVNPRTVPDPGGGPDVEIVGGPAQTETEPAWCRICGALWKKRAFSGFLGRIGVKQWGWVHPARDREARTLLNLHRDRVREPPASEDGGTE